MASPKPIHWNVMNCVLHYLFRTQSFGVTLNKVCDDNLVGNFDADWASDRTDCRSQASLFVYFKGTLVSWASQKQTTISRTNTEFENRSITTTVQELEWLTSLFYELGIHVKLLLYVKCDNLGATCLTSNPIYNAKTKHLHFVQERAEDKSMKVMQIAVKFQKVYILTKPNIWKYNKWNGLL